MAQYKTKHPRSAALSVDKCVCVYICVCVVVIFYHRYQ